VKERGDGERGKIQREKERGRKRERERGSRKSCIVRGR